MPLSDELIEHLLTESGTPGRQMLVDDSSGWMVLCRREHEMVMQIRSDGKLEGWIKGAQVINGMGSGGVYEHEISISEFSEVGMCRRMWSELGFWWRREEMKATKCRDRIMSRWRTLRQGDA